MITWFKRLFKIQIAPKPVPMKPPTKEQVACSQRKESHDQIDAIRAQLRNLGVEIRNMGDQTAKIRLADLTAARQTK